MRVDVLRGMRTAPHSGGTAAPVHGIYVGPSIYGPSIYGPSIYGPSIYGPSIYGPSTYGPSIYVAASSRALAALSGSTRQA